MDKSPEAFRTISDVAAAMDLPQHVLRFWETRFPQIKPLKRGGGRRYYRPDDVQVLQAIRRLLYDEGYTIKGVQKLLREHGAQAVIEGAADAPLNPQPSVPPGFSHSPPHDRGARETVAQQTDPVVSRISVAEKSDDALRTEQINFNDLRVILQELREAERALQKSRAN